MRHSLAEMDEIRRLRKHLIWVFVFLTLASVAHLLVSIGEAFLAGVSRQPDAASITPVVVIYLWAALIAFRLAKALDPRVHYYWAMAALMFLPVVNLMAIISLFMESGRVLAGPRIFK